MRKVNFATFECEKEDIEKVIQSLKSGYLSVGPDLTELQKSVAFMCGKKYGLMVNSGQSALEVSIAMAKIYLQKEKLKILVPSTTYSATLWAVLNQNCEAIFCDIGSDYNIDFYKLKHNIQDIDVVIPVDLCGKSLDKFQISKLKTLKPNIFIIEDACEAFGNHNCNYGDIICFSFYVAHHITSGQGGMLCCNNEFLINYAESYISHGRKFGGDFTAYSNEWHDRFIFDKVGVSYRSSNMNAALALSQFKRKDKIISKRQNNALTMINYYENSSKLKEGFYFPDEYYWKNSVFQFFPIRIINNSNLDRNLISQYLYKEGIDTRVLLSLTNQPAFINIFGDIESKYFMSKECNKNGFMVGCHQDLEEEDMLYICEKLERIIN